MRIASLDLTGCSSAAGSTTKRPIFRRVLKVLIPALSENTSNALRPSCRWLQIVLPSPNGSQSSAAAVYLSDPAAIKPLSWVLRGLSTSCASSPGASVSTLMRSCGLSGMYSELRVAAHQLASPSLDGVQNWRLGGPIFGLRVGRAIHLDDGAPQRG